MNAMERYFDNLQALLTRTMADGCFLDPTSTAVGAAMLQAMVARVKEISLAEGWEAEFFKSSNVDGGDAVNEKLIERYKDIILGLA